MAFKLNNPLPFSRNLVKHIFVLREDLDLFYSRFP
jgi:hypothetical protein